MGPYCRASTPRVSVRSTSSASWRMVSTGRASLAGEPPLKEMMSGLVMDPNSPLTTLAVKAIFPYAWHKAPFCAVLHFKGAPFRRAAV